MTALFETVLELSLKGSVVILAILAVRLLLLKAPKKFSYLLWSVAAFRLLIPTSFQSVFSIFGLGKNVDLNAVSTIPESSPVADTSISEVSQTVSNVINETSFLPDFSQPVGDAIIGNTSIPDSVINGVIPDAPIGTVSGGEVTIPETVTSEIITDVAENSAFLESLPRILATVWLIGMAAMLIYGIVSFILIKRKMQNAVLFEENVYFTDKITSPFTLGFIKPKIYLPFGLGDEELKYILAHERCHIKRLDHIIKPFAFVLLSVHWFNPLCWVAFNRMGLDMEMSCDEKIIGKNNGTIKKEYSRTLLALASQKRFPAPSPIAFNDSGSAKTRIKHALNWKKPKFWVTVLAVILCIATLVACVTDAVDKYAEDFEDGIPYKFTFESNGDGTCKITDIKTDFRHTEKFEITVPERSPDGDIVVAIEMPDNNGFNTFETLNVPTYITKEKMDAILSKINSYSDQKVTISETLSFDPERTPQTLTAFYMTVAEGGFEETPFYVLDSAIDKEEYDRLSAILTNFADYTEEDCLNDIVNFLDTVPQNDEQETNAKEGAFRHFYHSVRNVTKVIIPQSVTSVKDGVSSLYHYGAEDIYEVYYEIAGTGERFILENSKTDPAVSKAENAYFEFLKGQIPAVEGDQRFYIADMKTALLESGINSFSFCDLNGDEIPELHTYSHTYDVFTYKNGELLRIYKGDPGMNTYMLKVGTLFSYKTSGGSTYRFTEFDENFNQKNVEFYDASADEENNPYSFNGKEVTREEFYSLTAEYYEIMEFESVVQEWSKWDTDSYIGQDVDITESILYERVFNNGNVIDQWSGKTTFVTFLNTLFPSETADTVPFIIDSYSFIDLDSDTKNELVISFKSEYKYYVIARHNTATGEVYVYSKETESFGELKSDGTYLVKKGKNDNSIKELSFNGTELIEKELARKSRDSNVINSISVTEAQINAYFDNWNTLESAPFTKYFRVSVEIDDRNASVFEQCIKYIEDSPTNYQILISVTATVTDFKYFMINESENLEIGQTLLGLDELTPEIPLWADTYLNDATATRGFSFTDPNGIRRYYALRISMNDGSVYFEELTLGTVDFDAYTSYVFPVNSKLPEYRITLITDPQKPLLVTDLLITEHKSGISVQRISISGVNNPSAILYPEDLNGDGYQDFLIEYTGTFETTYYKAFVWDISANRFVYAPTFETIPNYCVDSKTSAIYGAMHSDFVGTELKKTVSYYLARYDSESKDFVITNTLSFGFSKKENDRIFVSVLEKKLENGNYTTVAEVDLQTDRYYSIDRTHSEISRYFQENSFWDLDGDRWKNILGEYQWESTSVPVTYSYQTVYTEIDDPMGVAANFPHSFTVDSKTQLESVYTENDEYHLYHTDVTKGDMPSYDAWIMTYSEEWFYNNRLVIIRARVDADTAPTVVSVENTGETLYIELGNYNIDSNNRQVYHIFIEIPKDVEFQSVSISDTE